MTKVILLFFYGINAKSFSNLSYVKVLVAPLLFLKVIEPLFIVIDFAFIFPSSVIVKGALVGLESPAQNLIGLLKIGSTYPSLPQMPAKLLVSPSLPAYNLSTTCKYPSS